MLDNAVLARSTNAAATTADGVETRLRLAKSAFTTRRVPASACRGLVTDCEPTPGDLVLARVESIGQHPRLQVSSGRRAQLYPGDEIVVCYGDRYATNQWEAVVPPTLEPCDLVAAGGVAGKVLSRHASSRRPTRLTPLGLLANERSGPINLRHHALSAQDQLPERLVPVVGVVGTSMDAGKTTAASALIRGLTLRGHRVAGIKLTGTGACGDYWEMGDAGATWVADFVDVGYVSTYRVAPTALVGILETLVWHAVSAGSDVIVAEIADGIAQSETAALVCSEPFRRAVGAILLAASDALGAQAAARWLTEHELPLRAVTGIASASMLSAHETRTLTGLPVLGIEDLASTAAEEWITRPQ